jgi:hypothetical protein
VRVGDREFSGIRPQQAEEFFYKEIIGHIDSKLRPKKTD